MYKYFVFVALVLSVGTPAIANPFCYMVTVEGELINLESICNISEPQPTIAASGSKPPVREEDPPSTQPIASFQVVRIAQDGKAVGRVNFTRAAQEGATVNPYVVHQDGRRWRAADENDRPITVRRERGQRRVEIEFRLPAGTNTSEVEGGV